MNFFSELFSCGNSSAAYVVAQSDSFRTPPPPSMQAAAAGAGAGRAIRIESTTASFSPSATPVSSPEGSPPSRVQNAALQVLEPTEEVDFFDVPGIRNIIFLYLGRDDSPPAKDYLLSFAHEDSEPEYNKYLAWITNWYLSDKLSRIRMVSLAPPESGQSLKKPSQYYKRPVMTAMQMKLHFGGAREKIFAENADIAAAKAANAQQVFEAMALAAQIPIGAVKSEAEKAAKKVSDALQLSQEKARLAQKAVGTAKNAAEEEAERAAIEAEEAKIAAEHIQAVQKAADHAEAAKLASAASTKMMMAARSAQAELLAAVQPQPLRVPARNVLQTQGSPPASARSEPFAQEIEGSNAEAANDFSSLQVTSEGAFHLNPLEIADLSSGSDLAIGADAIAADTPHPRRHPQFEFHGGAAAAAGAGGGYEAPPPSGEW